MLNKAQHHEYMLRSRGIVPM